MRQAWNGGLDGVPGKKLPQSLAELMICVSSFAPTLRQFLLELRQSSRINETLHAGKHVGWSWIAGEQ